MHLLIVIAIAAVLIVAAVIYIRRHTAVAAQVDADAQKLKTAAEQEAKHIEQTVETGVKKIEQAL